MRIATIHVGQETNDFNPLPTTIDDFKAFGILEGQEIIEKMAGKGQVGGIEVDLVSGEITYGLERLAMYLFDKKTVYELPFNAPDSDVPLTYGDVFLQNEQEQSAYNFEHADTEILFRHFADAEKECKSLLDAKLALPAYEKVLKAAHTFNLLDARGADEWLTLVQDAPQVVRDRRRKSG